MPVFLSVYVCVRVCIHLSIVFSYLGKGNLIFCCKGPTNPNFWQIKIIILISHTNLHIHSHTFFHILSHTFWYSLVSITDVETISIFSGHHLTMMALGKGTYMS